MKKKYKRVEELPQPPKTGDMVWKKDNDGWMDYQSIFLFEKDGRYHCVKAFDSDKFNNNEPYGVSVYDEISLTNPHRDPQQTTEQKKEEEHTAPKKDDMVWVKANRGQWQRDPLKYHGTCDGQHLVYIDGSKSLLVYDEVSLTDPYNPRLDLKHGDVVLCRLNNKDPWMIDAFGYIDKWSDFQFICQRGIWLYCIPYKGNEHLIGTTDWHAN